MGDIIEITYYGGDADSHALDLYDAGRALYGASRFIYTLENFRRTGVVVEHATSAKVRFKVAPPQAGSFSWHITDVMAVAGPDVAKAFINVPLSAVMAWAKDKLGGGVKAQEIEARKAVDLEREKTHQIHTTAIKDVAIAAIEARDRADERQLELLKAHQALFEQIEEEKVVRLLAKIRPQLVEMARPTTTTTGYMKLAVGDGVPLIYMDQTDVEALKGSAVDEEAETMPAKIIQYNNENGWGKVRTVKRKKPYPFYVPPMVRFNDADILLAETIKEYLQISFFAKRDKNATATSLVFNEFVERPGEDEEDETDDPDDLIG